jgi:urea-proton symporter
LGYRQRAIASNPATAVEGYFLGSVAWYAIPFGMSTAVGLAAAALQGSGKFAVDLTADQINASLAGPAGIISLMGSKGAYLFNVLDFMAVTSSTSAESIPASSLITFDIFKAYINPKASVRALLWVSIAGLCIYGAALSTISCIFHVAGISLSWLVSILGCIIGGGTLPMALIVLWDGTSTFAAIVSPLTGLVCGITSWMVATKLRFGVITVETTGDLWNAITGDCVSMDMGLICIVGFSYLVPDKKKFGKTEILEGQIPTTPEDQDQKEPVTPKDAEVSTSTKPAVASDPENSSPLAALESAMDEPEYVPTCALTPAEVQGQKRLALIALIVGTLGFLIIIPFTLYGTGYVFSQGFSYAYVIVAIVWAWLAFAVCVVMPLWESREGMIYVARYLVRDLVGR